MNTALQSQIDHAIQYQDNQIARDILIASLRDGDIKLDRKDYLRLSYLRMSSLSTEKLLDLIKESVLAAFEIPDFNLEEKLSDYIELLDYVPEQVALITKLKSILEQHTELLGDKPIIVKEKNEPPTIANWIRDLNNSTAVRHDVLDEIRYMNSSPNVKSLTIAKREALKMIFRIYDRMAQYTKFWEEIPEAIPEDEMREFEDYLESLDNSLAEGLEENNQPQPTAQAPQSVPPTIQAQPVIPQPVPQPLPRKPVPIIPTQPDAPPLYKIGAKGGRDLQSQPKKGLIYDTPTNINIDDEVRKRQHRQAELLKIQVKLDDLKKRKKKNP